ncbi:hypothetical protein TNIN_438731, partial [Trichonephila inaurata madagascariensis]
WCAHGEFSMCGNLIRLKIEAPDDQFLVSLLDLC